MKEDRIIEIARFYEPEKAQMLESLLKSEGINCYLRNEYSSQVMYPADMGGIRVELLESDAPAPLPSCKQTDTATKKQTKRQPPQVGEGTFRCSTGSHLKNVGRYSLLYSSSGYTSWSFVHN